MKIFKKSMAVILTVLMAISMMPFTANAADVSFTKVTSAGDITTDNIGTCTAEDAKAWALANWDVAHDYAHDTHLAFYSNTGELNVVLVDYGMNEHSFSRNFDYCINTSYSIFHLKTWYADGDAIFFCTAAAPAPGEPAEGAAEDGPLVGTVIKIGDTLTLDGDYFEFAPGLKTSTTADFELYQMSYNEDFNAWLFTFTPNDVVFLVEGDETPKPDGFYVSGGNGTESHPYTFALHYGPAPTTYTITWKLNENTVIDTTQVEEGETPAHAAPADYEDAENTYTFAGWNDGTTTYGLSDTLPNVTADVTYTATFEATPKTPAPAEPNNGTNITVADTISENFYIDGDYYGEDAYITAEYNHNTNVGETADVRTDIVRLNTLTAQSGGDYDGTRIFSVKQAPAQGTEPIVIKVFLTREAAEAGTDPSAEFTYSTYSYCREILDSETYSDMWDLAEATLDYCAAAQLYFGYNTANMATKDNAGNAFYNDFDTPDFSAVASISKPACITSASLVCKSDLEINLMTRDFVEIVDTPTITTEQGGERFGVTTYQNGGYYVVHITGIEPANMNNTISISTNLGEITLTANSIMKAMAGSSNANLATLAKAMYAYGAAAEAYFV